MYHKAKWKHRKSGNIRYGKYWYCWGGDYFLVKINGIHQQRIYDEHPSTKNWEFVGQVEDTKEEKERVRKLGPFAWMIGL